ncbi:MAG: prepilin-type N-terminal cleavage/methylation domain-containing protein [Acidobacteriota bacterium]|nr:prepilin-type N-terminal cleavage/methylation domain-containing protein [Acidobacteriota bacterium]MDH3530184.1 prepilin-type N-terminal cleavage/methylation domain-containing protein [Acidobacteriota bacterium]
MKIGIRKHVGKTPSSCAGFSVIEVLIVVIVISIVVVLALPQIMSSRRLLAFASVQRELTTYLREARQIAMSERKPITFQFNDTSKTITLYGGSLGPVGTAQNRILDLKGLGIEGPDIVYGRPPGATVAALGDGTNMTGLTSNAVEITFEGDGSVLDGSDNPQNNALFFYHAMYPQETAFGLSILGAGGRVKVWDYSAGLNAYVE